MNHVGQHNVIGEPARASVSGDEGLSLDGILIDLSGRSYRSALADSTIQAKAPVNTAKAKWKKWVEDAGQVWTRLTEDDLAALAGHRQTLTQLVKTRYRLSMLEADRQVTSFIEDHQLCAL